MGALNGKGDFGSRPRKALYEVIDKDGRKYGPWATAFEASCFAHRTWPDQDQDEDRTGKGWDLQVKGCDQ